MAIKPIKSLNNNKKSYCYIYFVFSSRHFLVMLKIIMVKKSK